MERSSFKFAPVKNAEVRRQVSPQGCSMLRVD